ncbi:hypothetical protein ACCUM_3168 [Candidatus Accumulibacter phosphatis]|uniref:Uncharacterized protein n=1 Tax=Candidatus Accumulibacter phosphatis TaxID=327160 RepID=A0A5S4EQ69_9PROT|nr:hypothetical protein ACCUM_3168 [Candidatus Accumulibacter phosphatis]
MSMVLATAISSRAVKASLHQTGGQAAEGERRAERQFGGEAALATMRPGLSEVEFDTGDHHEPRPTRRCRSATAPPPG